MSQHSKTQDLEKYRASESQLENVAAETEDFGGESTLPPPPTLTAEEERKLWRKVDLRLMPILSLLYLFSFLDRGMPQHSDYRFASLLTHTTGNIGLFCIEFLHCRYIVYSFPQETRVYKDLSPNSTLREINITLPWYAVKVHIKLT